jgi:hypothetical protein
MLSIPMGIQTHYSQGTRITQNDERKQLKYLSTGEPTYWPPDRNKLPDIVGFCVTNGIPQDFAAAKSSFDLSSDHSPVLITLTAHALNQEKQPSLSNRHTKWDDFRHLISQRLTLNVSLTIEEDTEAAVKSSTYSTVGRQCNATPEHGHTQDIWLPCFN